MWKFRWTSTERNLARYIAAFVSGLLVWSFVLPLFDGNYPQWVFYGMAGLASVLLTDWIT